MKLKNGEKKKTINVFISSPTSERQFVNVLTRALQKEGAVHVLDPHDIKIGQSWESEIRKQISAADVVISILPEEVNSNRFIYLELGAAKAMDKEIITIATPKVSRKILPEGLFDENINYRGDLDKVVEKVISRLKQTLTESHGLRD